MFFFKRRDFSIKKNENFNYLMFVIFFNKIVKKIFKTFPSVVSLCLVSLFSLKNYFFLKEIFKKFYYTNPLKQFNFNLYCLFFRY